MRTTILGGDAAALKSNGVLNAVNFGFSKVYKYPKTKLRVESGALLTFYSGTFKHYDGTTMQNYNWKYHYAAVEVPCLFGMQLQAFYFGGGPTMPILVYYNEPSIKPMKTITDPQKPERFGFITMIPSIGFRMSAGYQFIVNERRASVELTSSLYKDFWNVNHYGKPLFIAYGLGLKYNFTREPSTREMNEKMGKGKDE